MGRGWADCAPHRRADSSAGELARERERVVPGGRSATRVADQLHVARSGRAPDLLAAFGLPREHGQGDEARRSMASKYVSASFSQARRANALIGLVTDGERVRPYVCDSRRWRPGSPGKLEDGQAELRSRDASWSTRRRRSTSAPRPSAGAGRPRRRRARPTSRSRAARTPSSRSPSAAPTRPAGRRRGRSATRRTTRARSAPTSSACYSATCASGRPRARGRCSPRGAPRSPPPG